jgi:Toprim-like
MKALDIILSRLPNAKKVSGGWLARCVAHADKSPSLSIREGRAGVLLHCFAGCSVSEITTELGLRTADLFDRHLDLHMRAARPQRPPTADEVEAILRAHLQRVIDREAAELGHASAIITSEHINAARRTVSRLLGIALSPIAPTPEEMEAIRAHVHHALTDCSSLFSVAGAPGLAYLRSRKLHLATAYDADVKYHPDWLRCGPAAVFAIRDQNGAIVGAQGRFLDPFAKPKALSKGSIKCGAFMTPGTLASDVTGIAEAPIDAISLALSGLPSLAIIGSSNYSKPWFWPHLKASRIILAVDADPAGKKAADNLRRVLGSARCELFTFPPGCNDVNDYLCADADAFAAYVRTLCLGDAPSATGKSLQASKVQASPACIEA